MDKKGYKKLLGKCSVCDKDLYSVLDVHRIEHGGKYVRGNTVVLCSNCHRRHHAGEIEIVEKKYSTGGWLLIYKENGEEFIKSVIR